MSKETVLSLVNLLTSRYYATCETFDYSRLHPIGNREYAYFDTQGKCHRGLVFNNVKEIQAALRTPGLVSFHSGVHTCRNPWSTKRDHKVLLALGLALDFDIPRTNNRDFSFEKQAHLLESIRALIETLFIGQLGLSWESLEVYFSGSKGFHMYIKDSELNTLLQTFESLETFLGLLEVNALRGLLRENPYTLNFRSEGKGLLLHLDKGVSTDLNKLIKAPFSLNKSTFLKSFQVDPRRAYTGQELLDLSLPEEFQRVSVRVSLDSPETFTLPGGESYVVPNGESSIPGHVFLWLTKLDTPLRVLAYGNS